KQARVWVFVTVTLLASLVFAVLVVPGQTPAQTYRAPRTPDGKPNLNGIWQALNEANWDIEAHSAAPAHLATMGALGAVPPGICVVEGGSLPYKPEALQQRKKNFESRLTMDPEVKCYLPGVPRAMYMPFPFQIIQSQKIVMMMFEYAGGIRTINMDSTKPAP